MSPTEEVCEVDGATLRVRRTGSGPALLLIAGGLGAADSYRALAARLADEYTVLTYDRRGHFGSADHTESAIPIARHAADARAVIQQSGFRHALVFATSAGAIIGLELASAHPDAVAGLIAHEPPAVRLLPDADQWLGFAEHQLDLYEHGDLNGAFTQFIGSLAGAGVPDLRLVRLPNEHEWSVLFGRELRSFYHYLPDIAALRRCGAPIVPAGGVDSRGYYHYRPAERLAAELEVAFGQLPGAHLGPQRNPGAFAQGLRHLLAIMDAAA